MWRIDLDQSSTAALSGAVDGTCHQFLAGARFPQNQHCGIGGRHLLHPVQNVLQSIAPAHDVLEVMLRLDFFLQIGAFSLQPILKLSDFQVGVPQLDLQSVYVR